MIIVDGHRQAQALSLPGSSRFAADVEACPPLRRQMIPALSRLHISLRIADEEGWGKERGRVRLILNRVMSAINEQQGRRLVVGSNNAWLTKFPSIKPEWTSRLIESMLAILGRRQHTLVGKSACVVNW